MTDMNSRRRQQTVSATKRLCGITLLCMALGGCAGCGRYHVEATSNIEEAPRTAYPTVAILPPIFMMEHRPHQVFQYTYDLIEALSIEHGIPTVAPWEYDPDGVMLGSRRDALRAITYFELDTTDLVVLEFRLEEDSASRAIAQPISLGGGVQFGYESDITLTLSMRSFPQGLDLVSVSVEFTDEPFAEGATMANPRPLLRQAVRRAADEMAEIMKGSWFSPVMGSPPDLDLRFNPVEVFRYQGGAGEPLESDFAELDELDRLAYSIGYYEYFKPGVSAQTVKLFEQSPPGLLVEGIGPGCRDCGLEESDFIVAVNGQAVAGPQSLLRPFLRSSTGGPVELTVSRDGEERVLRVVIPTAD